MENTIKKYFNVLRNNEDLSYGGLRTLKIIEDEFDNMNRALAKQSNENGTLPIPDIIPRFCFICGTKLMEVGLGWLQCESEQCGEVYLPFIDENNNQCLMHQLTFK